MDIVEWFTAERRIYTLYPDKILNIAEELQKACDDEVADTEKKFNICPVFTIYVANGVDDRTPFFNERQQGDYWKASEFASRTFDINATCRIGFKESTFASLIMNNGLDSLVLNTYPLKEMIVNPDVIYEVADKYRRTMMVI